MKSYKEMPAVDLKLRLLSGSSIKVDNFEIEPYTLEEVKEYGYTNYMRNLQWLSLTVDDFINSVIDIDKRIILEQQKDKLKTFDFYTKLGGQEMLEGLLEALAMIFKTNDVRLLENNVIAVDFVKMGIFEFDEDGNTIVNKEKLDNLADNELKIVHRDNFDDIVEVVKIQNYLIKVDPEKDEEDDLNPADEETKKLMEQMKKIRKKVEEKKRQQQMQDDEDIDIADIVSAVSSKSNSINELNVWKLTIYQLYSKYARLELIDNYNFAIKAMMAGADKIDLTHWSSRI